MISSLFFEVCKIFFIRTSSWKNVEHISSIETHRLALALEVSFPACPSSVTSSSETSISEYEFDECRFRNVESSKGFFQTSGSATLWECFSRSFVGRHLSRQTFESECHFHQGFQHSWRLNKSQEICAWHIQSPCCSLQWPGPMSVFSDRPGGA